MDKILSVRLNDDLYKKTEVIAQKFKRSKNWVIREVLENYLEELFDLEEAKKILLSRKDEVIPHEQAKKEILSD
ncbi:MAG TPA: ribbon-helix-helix protein, CopG family [bacterium]|nr:ribbon-helix-helix protein, CopG family [bacterium]